jgi:hypothetical protein
LGQKKGFWKKQTINILRVLIILLFLPFIINNGCPSTKKSSPAPTPTPTPIWNFIPAACGITGAVNIWFDNSCYWPTNQIFQLVC